MKVVRAALVAALALAAPAAAAEERFITLASATSAEDSGLFGHILPLFTARTGFAVRVVSIGTGAAIKLGENGDADVLLVHDPVSEERFVAQGFGVDRRPVMVNDFVLVGPASDPAGVNGLKDVAEAFRRLAAARASFVSRADQSGTHKAEFRFWRAAGVDPRGGSGTWYLEAGLGQGATLNIAAAMGAYMLADRGTWLAFRNRRDLVIAVEGDPRLQNPYHVILVNPALHPQVKINEARAFMDWLTSAEGQRAIADYRVAGERLFEPVLEEARE
ncbi:MAG: substrate-binding domain-containing protein [Alphaproteobacteria bacterium]